MARTRKGGLGKGLNAIIEDATIESGTSTGQDHEIEISSIHPNPNQPRKHFDEKELADLAVYEGEKIITELSDEEIYEIFTLSA